MNRFQNFIFLILSLNFQLCWGHVSFKDLSKIIRNVNKEGSIQLVPKTIHEELDKEGNLIERRVVYRILAPCQKVSKCENSHLIPSGQTTINFPRSTGAKRKRSTATYNIHQDSYQVGEVTLLEHCDPLPTAGKFYLDLLVIDDQFQGQGLGRQALQQILALGKNLAATGDKDYEFLDLRSADPEVNGKDLTNTGRVRFYTLNGAHMRPETAELLSFLSLKKMINGMDIKHFRSYLNFYFTTHPLIGSRIRGPGGGAFLKSLLQKIKDEFNFKTWSEDEQKQMVYTNCAVCAQDILDRAFYVVSDLELKHFSELLYLLRFNLKADTGPTVTVQKAEGKVRDEVDLHENYAWANEPDQANLSPEQIALNEFILKQF